jgi:hypothetical protein
MKTAVFSFINPSPNSMIASARIARFVAKTLNVPLLWDASVRDTRWDVLILVNGAFSFCNVRDDLAVAVRRAKRIVWIQNDYAIYPPVPDGVAESTFRRAFVIREERGRPRMDLWTTIEENAQKTKSSRYVNWNMLTALKIPLRITRNHSDDLFYYGSWRQYRDKSFDRFFSTRRIPVSISSASKKFAERYPHARAAGMIERGAFFHELNAHGFGLYIEDVRSHRQFHSPANRFYEMLSAGLPMLFEPESRAMLQKAGFDPKDFIVRNARDVRDRMTERHDIAHDQCTRWWRPFREELTNRVVRIYASYLRRHFS